MTRSFKSLLTGLGIVSAAITFMPSDAKAYGNDYCREYTRTVYIGNRAQDAYGTACLQPDGSWMIVGEGLGNDIPDNVSNVNYVIHDTRREVVPTRVVYVNRRPSYFYNPRPAFVWSHNGHYRNGIYINYSNNHYKYKSNKKWDRYDDRHRYNGRGRGHGHH